MNERQTQQETVGYQLGRRMLIAMILGCSAAALLGADEEPPQASPAEQEQADTSGRPDELVEMTVQYDKAMLVVVAKNGAAGIRFIEPFELGNKSGNGVVGASYEWRFLAREPGAEEQTGTGRVFAKLIDRNVRDGSLTVKCGPIELTWAYREKAFGMVRYNPRDVAVHPVAVEYFAKKDARDRREPIDLGQFLQPKEGTRAGRAAGPLFYKRSVLVVSDSTGIATFEFGTAFERAKGANQELRGVPYNFTFVSPAGEMQKGEGEVYETYTNGKYDRGQLELEAGPLRIEWSLGGDELGWIYYKPPQKLIWCVDKPYAKQLVGAIAADAGVAAGER